MYKYIAVKLCKQYVFFMWLSVWNTLFFFFLLTLKSETIKKFKHIDFE